MCACYCYYSTRGRERLRTFCSFFSVSIPISDTAAHSKKMAKSDSNQVENLFGKFRSEKGVLHREKRAHKKQPNNAKRRISGLSNGTSVFSCKCNRLFSKRFIFWWGLFEGEKFLHDMCNSVELYPKEKAISSC